MKNDTQDLDSLAKGRNIVQHKCVSHIKYATNGLFERYKACIVDREFFIC